MPIRTRACEVCAAEFSYDISRGADRRICSDFCRGKKRHANRKARPLCSVEGCINPRDYANPAVCNSCYCRIRRTGTVVKRTWAYRSLGSNGYVRLFDNTHPLAVNGYVYEHRKVLYDAIGQGPHPCHWCSTPVDWIKGKCFKGSLVPDHLDNVKTNNVSANLVPACNQCNTLRGQFMAWVSSHQDDPLLWEIQQRYKATPEATLEGTPSHPTRRTA